LGDVLDLINMDEYRPNSEEIMTRDIQDLYERLGYIFKDPELLAWAFRHSSYVNERKEAGLNDNERLEFLGDAVLSLAISHILMDNYKGAKEGDLSKYRAIVVNERGLCQIAMELGLGDYLLLGKGEELTDGRKKPSILADTVESLLGALYLDAGFQRTKDIISRLFLPLINGIESGNMNYDYKSIAQEYTQETYRTLPEYVLMEENGLAHDKTFRVAFILNGKTIAEGIGKSKKEAEQRAAIVCQDIKKSFNNTCLYSQSGLSPSVYIL
jgi:ribonuclease-3